MLPFNQARRLSRRDGGGQQFILVGVEIVSDIAPIRSNQMRAWREDVVIMNREVECALQFAHERGQILFIAENVMNVDSLRGALLQHFDQLLKLVGWIERQGDWKIVLAGSEPDKTVVSRSKSDELCLVLSGLGQVSQVLFRATSAIMANQKDQGRT